MNNCAKGIILKRHKITLEAMTTIIRFYFALMYILATTFSISIAHSQDLMGKIVIDHLYSSSLENNGGENPMRRLTVYLPPGYDTSQTRYPVIYFLHGFTVNDSINYSWFNTGQKLDLAISSGKIGPFIFVISDQYTSFRGSFYTNSRLTGNWADFTAIDIVDYIDGKYRTLPEMNSRGIAGWSMGGFGAIKVSLLFPGVFGALYSLSPACLGLVEELGPNSDVYRQAFEIDSREELIKGYDHFYPNVVVAMGRTFSPNPNNPPFYADLPYSYTGDGVKINTEVLQLWKNNMPMEMNDTLFDNLRELKAIKIDWGRNDQNKHIPVSCRQFSEKLDSIDIKHFAEEYNGNHSNMLWTEDGRAINDMFPFFNTYLRFE
jgi:enterochelin esterase-like enzyme